MKPPSKESGFLKLAREYIAKGPPEELEHVTPYYLMKIFLEEVDRARKEGFEAARVMTVKDLGCVTTQHPTLKYPLYEDYLKEMG